MITDANYGLSLQSTRQLVNLSTTTYDYRSWEK